MARLQQIYTIKPLGWQNPKKIGHNTLAWRDLTDSFSIRYHRTVVVQYDSAAETLFVNTSGWFSVTTLQRIRHGLNHLGLDLSTSDIKGRWRIMDNKGNAWSMRGNSITLKRDFKTNSWSRVTNN